jgi:uncharacterized protein with HEPN domain
MHRTELQFLDDIFLAICNIEEDTTGISFVEYTLDRRRKDAIIRNFEVIGEATKKLSEDIKARYPTVAWKRIAGLRDVIAHGYFNIDYELIWGIITNTLPGFKEEIIRIKNEESQREKNSGFIDGH